MQMRSSAAAVLFLLVVPPTASAFQADLVPTTARPDASEITGVVSIRGEDGTVRVTIANVNDAAGDPLDSDRLIVQLKLRVDGRRRRVTVPLTVDGGDGEATTSLGLSANTQVIVSEVRVRGADHRTLAMAGVLTMPEASTPAPAPPAADCPTALQSCQFDLDQCNQDLNDCLSGN